MLDDVRPRAIELGRGHMQRVRHDSHSERAAVNGNAAASEHEHQLRSRHLDFDRQLVHTATDVGDCRYVIDHVVGLDTEQLVVAHVRAQLVVRQVPVFVIT